MAKTRSKKSEKKPRAQGQRPAGFNEQRVVDRVWSLAEPLCASQGLELVQIEFQREAGGRVLRLYIDKAGGIKLDDCVSISREMGDVLDVALDPVGPYRLEVSSPGLNRPLVKKHDFERFKGKRAKIKTRQPINGQKTFSGVLLGVSGEQVNLKIEQQTVAITYGDISKAQLAQ